MFIVQWSLTSKYSFYFEDYLTTKDYKALNTKLYVLFDKIQKPANYKFVFIAFF